MSRTMKKLLTLLAIVIALALIGVPLGLVSPWWGIGEGVLAAIIVLILFPAEATHV